MPDARTITKQLVEITRHLIRIGLCDDQNYPSSKFAGSSVTIAFDGAQYISSLMKDMNYCDLYNIILEKRIFNIKMIDGACIQFMYEFEKDHILRHRAAFFPSPDLEEFQNNPEPYEEDDIFLEIVSRRIFPIPLRVDYDKCYIDGTSSTYHPTTHLTLGQYSECRIPVSSPVTPYHFMRFILKHFYTVNGCRYYEDMKNFGGGFAATLTTTDMNEIIFSIPNE